jgi:hypothetical protein
VVPGDVSTTAAGPQLTGVSEPARAGHRRYSRQSFVQCIQFLPARVVRRHGVKQQAGHSERVSECVPGEGQAWPVRQLQQGAERRIRRLFDLPKAAQVLGPQRRSIGQLGEPPGEVAEPVVQTIQLPGP